RSALLRQLRAEILDGLVETILVEAARIIGAPAPIAHGLAHHAEFREYELIAILDGARVEIGLLVARRVAQRERHAHRRGEPRGHLGLAQNRRRALVGLGPAA